MRWPFKRRAGSEESRSAAMLIVHEAGERSDRFVACLESRLASLELTVHRKGPLFVVFDPSSPGQHALQEVLTTHLDACDSSWRDFATFGKTWRGGSLAATSR
jgi:hypothetical protein